MKIRTPLIALAATALLVAGCANEDTDTSPESAPTVTTGAAAASATADQTEAEGGGETAGAADAPTAEELQDQLTLLADPAQPIDAKVAVVENGEERRPNLEAMTAAMTNYQVGFEVTDVQAEGDTATADVAVESPHGTAAPTPWTWVEADGEWKVSDESTCALLGMARAGC
ncbi:hypothetical protein [Rhodococcus rhodnii]|uniref:hypothetical protein n=1 Tax=Rhodococcus rhodnii TaxID=38312 RepID=UPI00039C9C8C|nr:hypothetical protein [Rhodococcus rhodnii]